MFTVLEGGSISGSSRSGVFRSFFYLERYLSDHCLLLIHLDYSVFARHPSGFKFQLAKTVHKDFHAALNNNLTSRGSFPDNIENANRDLRSWSKTVFGTSIEEENFVSSTKRGSGELV